MEVRDNLDPDGLSEIRTHGEIVILRLFRGKQVGRARVEVKPRLEVPHEIGD